MKKSRKNMVVRGRSITKRMALVDLCHLKLVVKLLHAVAVCRTNRVGEDDLCRLREKIGQQPTPTSVRRSVRESYAWDI